MGGIQSMSRSTYSKLLPETRDTASYFSFYDVCDKIGTVLGTLSFGYVAEFLGGMRDLLGAGALKRAGAFQHQRRHQDQRQQCEPGADSEKLLEFHSFAAETDA